MTKTNEKSVCNGCIYLQKLNNTQFHRCGHPKIGGSKAFYTNMLMIMSENLNDIALFNKTDFPDNKFKIRTSMLQGSVFPFKFILKNNIVERCDLFSKLDLSKISIPDSLPKEF
jgi:hypothetical protein